MFIRYRSFFYCPPPPRSNMQATLLILATLLSTTFAAAPFVITSGADACKLVDDGADKCVQTANYPNDYDSDDECKITLQSTGKLKVVDFVTEETYDYATLKGTKYSGTSGPNNVAVTKGDTLDWLSDRGTNEKGFKICFIPPVVCDKTDGKAQNDESKECSCGTTICTTSSGFFCNANKNVCGKTAIPTCSKTDGAGENTEGCVCGSGDTQKICDAADKTGLYCNAGKNLCAKVAVPTCSKQDGALVNAGSCVCGSGINVCTSTSGFYCHGSLDLCAKVNNICRPNEHVVSKKCVSCTTGHKKAGDDPAGADTLCDVFVPATRADLQAGILGCLGSCSLSEAGTRGSHCYVQGGLGSFKNIIVLFFIWLFRVVSFFIRSLNYSIFF